jgi:hypothetical protein
MVGLCRYCAYEHSDCKGNKDLEKLNCGYYKKKPVQNVKEMAERVAELEIKLKDSVEVVRCKDCRHRDLFSCPLADNDFQKDEDFCSWGERREE